MSISLSGSLLLTGSIVASGNLTTTGTITAQTLVVQTITSSIVNITGSNIFGSRLSDTQTFTGSVVMTGSLVVNTTGPELQVNNNGVILGNLTADNHSITGSLRVNGPTACFSSTLFGNIISGNAAAISGSGTFGTCMSNGDFTIISNSSPFVIRGRQTFDRGFLGLTWDISPDVGVMLGNSLGFNTNAIPGSTIGTRALTLACNGNVGIGTCNPSVKLDILGNNEVMNISGTNAVSAYTGYYYNTSTLVGYIGNGSSILSGAASSDFIFRSQGALVYATNGNNERLRITCGGNVGIGDPSPSSRLSIRSGDIRFYDPSSNLNAGFELLWASNNGGTDVTYASIQGITTSAGNRAGEFRFYTSDAGAPTERMRLNRSGFLFVGCTTNSGFSQAHRIKGPSSTENTDIISIDGGIEYAGLFRAVSGANYSGAGTGIIVGRNSSTGRSINTGGTINASGTDYAEYMLKATTDAIAKGDIVGINSQGKLTNIFEDSVSFVVKSTDPSYVGGDTWGSVDNIGKLSPEATEEEKEEYEAKLETERAKVDRIAFSGQVPCNVTGATVGDYIIPIELENGKIGGQAVSNPTLEQYRISVGKVWKIMEDGRAWIAVKIG